MGEIFTIANSVNNHVCSGLRLLTVYDGIFQPCMCVVAYFMLLLTHRYRLQKRRTMLLWGKYHMIPYFIWYHAPTLQKSNLQILKKFQKKS
jgi:hypothetical protein